MEANRSETAFSNMNRILNIRNALREWDVNDDEEANQPQLLNSESPRERFSQWVDNYDDSHSTRALIDQPMGTEPTSVINLFLQRYKYLAF